jgi:hypothetical protein
MKTFTAQFKLRGNIGIGKMDLDAIQTEKLVSDAIANTFLQGKAKLTKVKEFFIQLDDDSGEKEEVSAEYATIIDISLYLKEAEGKNFKLHKAAITKKAVATLRNSKMFLSYLWQKKNTEHIGLETIFV